MLSFLNFITHKRRKYIFSDLLRVFILLCVWFLAKTYLGIFAETIFLFLSIFFVLFFGYKHHGRQLFIVTLFLMVFWLSVFVIEPASYAMIITHTILMISVSVGIYFSVAGSRKIHYELNKEYIVQKKGFNKIAAEKKLRDISIDKYNGSISMMVSIYDITKKMVAAMTFEDILNLCISFFNKNFEFSNYIIFKYDVDTKEYSSLYDKAIKASINDNLKDKLLKNKWIYNNEKVLLLRQGDSHWEDFIGAIPPSVQSLLIISLVEYNTVINGAVLYSEDQNYFTNSIIKYLKVFSRQMALGIEKVLLYEDVQEKSRKDGLTNLFTRNYWEERFDKEIKKSERYNSNLALLILDIDFFKKYNDEYGHLIGDEILREIAAVITNAVYSTDIIGRYGGEEFVIVMPMVTREEAIIKAEKIRRLIEGKKFASSDAGDISKEKITISIGLSCYPDDAVRKIDLIEKADNALYYAKRNGRNQVIDYLKMKELTDGKEILG